jgi:hypothetical protein
MNKTTSYLSVQRRKVTSGSNASRSPILFHAQQHPPSNRSLVSEEGRTSSVRVAVIDGPYDAAGLSGILARDPINLGTGHCGSKPNSACDHGTFIVGLLGARRDASIPGLCPDCQLLHVPLFVEENSASASVYELANAIKLAVASGARLLNLSLAILNDNSSCPSELAGALDCAQASGAVVVAAAGNQGRRVKGHIILTHPATIPVVAIDADGRLLPNCNFGPAFLRRGIAAFGHEVRGYVPGGGTAVMSGTSVAAAVATGVLAQVWSARPKANADDIRAAVAQLSPRSQFIPPILDRDALLTSLEEKRAVAAAVPGLVGKADGVCLQGETSMNLEYESPTSLNRTVGPASLPGQGESACACAGTDNVCTCNKGARGGFVYAIGTVEAEYPNIAIEREMQVMAHALGVEAEPDPAMPLRPTEDRSWQHTVLSRNRKITRYLARQLSWRLTVENSPAFVLSPRDPTDFDELIDCLARPKYLRQARAKRKKGTAASPGTLDPPSGDPQDLDVVIGTMGSQTANGIDVLMDQVFTIQPEQLSPPGLGAYFKQLADNHGLTDEERAYNYLMARYAISPENLKEINKDFELAGVPTMYSRLGAGNRRVVRVIYTFNSKGPNSPAQRKFFVRVDVTDEFPFIVTSWNQYLQRGDES